MAIPSRTSDITRAEDVPTVARGTEGLKDFCVDVEADAMHHFKARLCFVQVGTDTDIFLIDTLSAGAGLNALGPVLGNAAVTKFFHAASGDLQYLAEAGLRVRGLFDTHRAATLLGWPKVGLADLVQQFCGQTLKKEHQQSDFSLRPLPADMREYIADDVRYLTDIGRLVVKACVEADILEEVQLDCERMCDEAVAPSGDAPYQAKLPTAGASPHALQLGHAIAQELHQLRLRWAEEADVPMGRMLSNAAVGAIAMKPPATDRELVRCEGVRGAFVRQYGTQVLEVVSRLSALQKEGALPQMERKASVDPKVRKREDALTTFRKAAAVERKVTPSVVLPNSLVGEISRTAPQSLEALRAVKYFGEKRAAKYGDAIVALMRQYA